MKSLITVTGHGKASGRPDFASVQVTVTTEAEKAVDARTANNAGSKCVVEVLKKFVDENALYVGLPASILNMTTTAFLNGL